MARPRISFSFGSRPFATFGTLGLLIEMILGSLSVYEYSQDPFRPESLSTPLRLLPFAFVGIALLWLSTLVLSLIWKKASDTDDKLRGRVGFAVLFGYLLLAAGVASVVVSDTRQSYASFAGLGTQAVAVGGIAVVRIQTPTNITVPFNLFYRPVLALRVRVDNISSFQGNIAVGIERADPPLTSIWPDVGFNETNVGSTPYLLMAIELPQIQSGASNITYVVRHNIRSSIEGNFTGSQTGTFLVGIKSGQLTSGSYFVLIFAGVLTSYWWRIANDYLIENKIPYDKNETKQMTFFLLVPFFSAIVAAVIFGEFLQQRVAQPDPLTSGIAVFIFGFFWENAAKKFGETMGFVAPKPGTGTSTPAPTSGTAPTTGATPP